MGEIDRWVSNNPNPFHYFRVGSMDSRSVVFALSRSFSRTYVSLYITIDRLMMAYRCSSNSDKAQCLHSDKLVMTSIRWFNSSDSVFKLFLLGYKTGINPTYAAIFDNLIDVYRYLSDRPNIQAMKIAADTKPLSHLFWSRIFHFLNCHDPDPSGPSIRHLTMTFSQWVSNNINTLRVQPNRFWSKQRISIVLRGPKSNNQWKDTCCGIIRLCNQST